MNEELEERPAASSEPDSCQEAADRIDALNVEIARQLRELETYTRRARRFTRCYSCSWDPPLSDLGANGVILHLSDRLHPNRFSYPYGEGRLVIVS